MKRLVIAMLNNVTLLMGFAVVIGLMMIPVGSASAQPVDVFAGAQNSGGNGRCENASQYQGQTCNLIYDASTSTYGEIASSALRTYINVSGGLYLDNQWC